MTVDFDVVTVSHPESHEFTSHVFSRTCSVISKVNHLCVLQGQLEAHLSNQQQFKTASYTPTDV